MKKIIYIILSLVAIASKAQVLSYDFYTFRLNNMFTVNPAYSSKGDDLNIMVGAQSQNKGVPFDNKNFIVGAYSKISEKQALGGKVISDTRGAFRILKADLSYAYIVKLNEVSRLSMGLSGGVLNSNFMVTRIENYELLDLTDPTLSQSDNTTQFVAGAGLLYNFRDLEVSIAMPHILTTNQTSNGYINSAVFYTIKAKEKFKITPWIAYQNIPVTKSVFSGHVKTMYNDAIWVQVGYQTNNSFNAALGLNIENLSIGYGFRFSNKQFTEITTGTHEISIAYKVGRGKKEAPTISGELTGNQTSLSSIILRMDKLLENPITDANRGSIKAELEKIKKELKTAEIDNSSPEKAEEVAKQLKEIDDKLKLIEKALSNE